MKAWVAPESRGKPDIEPYVWTFRRDGSDASRKSPKNIFVETDIYTIPGQDDDRDLRLEHGLQELEDAFTRIRNLTLSKGKWPNAEQIQWLLIFVAASQIRSRSFRDHSRAQWGNLRKAMEDIEVKMCSSISETRAASKALLPPVPESSHRGMTLDEVKKYEQFPVQTMIGPLISVMARSFIKMNLAVLESDDSIGFITTDHPCTWFDPEAYKLPPMYRSPALRSRTVEITMPISPTQCLMISHAEHMRGFVQVNQEAVDILNHRHIGHCSASFISRTSTIRPSWFEVLEPPEDSWEKVTNTSRNSGS